VRISGCTTDHTTLSIAPHLPEHELFQGLPDGDLAALDERSTALSFAKGELIYSPFDRGESIFLLEEGRVRIYRSAHDGRQLTLAMLDPGMSFGQVAVLEHELQDAYAEALTDCSVRLLTADALERAMAEHPQLALNLMRALASRLRDAEDQVESLAFRPVPARLAGKLLELMDRYGRVTPSGIRIDERFTHLQLAEMIGTSRETLTKVLNELRDEHLIDVRERLVWVLDVDGLERLKGA